MDVKVIQKSQNRLARYLAEDGVMHEIRLVDGAMRIGTSWQCFPYISFERVKEFWRFDMRLDNIAELFEKISEDEYDIQHGD